MSVSNYAWVQKEKINKLVKSSAVKSPVLHDGLLAVLQLLYWLNSPDVAGCWDKSVYLHEDNVTIEFDKYFILEVQSTIFFFFCYY